MIGFVFGLALIFGGAGVLLGAGIERRRQEKEQEAYARRRARQARQH